MSVPPDKRTAVNEFFRSVGASEQQALDAEAAHHLAKFDFVGDVLVIKDTMVTVKDPKSLEWLRDPANKIAHLLPPVHNDDLQALIDRSYVGRGNLTARGKLIEKVGEAEANRLAQVHGLHSISDTRPGVRPTEQTNTGKKPDGKERDNPWLDNDRNVDPVSGRYTQAALNRQFALARANPVMAASIAKAAGAALGDIRPPGRVRRIA